MPVTTTSRVDRIPHTRPGQAEHGVSAAGFRAEVHPMPGRGPGLGRARSRLEIDHGEPAVGRPTHPSGLVVGHVVPPALDAPQPCGTRASRGRRFPPTPAEAGDPPDRCRTTSSATWSPHGGIAAEPNDVGTRPSVQASCPQLDSADAGRRGINNIIASACDLARGYIHGDVGPQWPGGTV
jgi:hypothetical protein